MLDVDTMYTQILPIFRKITDERVPFVQEFQNRKREHENFAYINLKSAVPKGTPELGWNVNGKGQLVAQPYIVEYTVTFAGNNSQNNMLQFTTKLRYPYTLELFTDQGFGFLKSLNPTDRSHFVQGRWEPRQSVTLRFYIYDGTLDPSQETSPEDEGKVYQPAYDTDITSIESVKIIQL